MENKTIEQVNILEDKVYRIKTVEEYNPDLVHSNNVFFEIRTLDLSCIEKRNLDFRVIVKNGSYEQNSEFIISKTATQAETIDKRGIKSVYFLDKLNAFVFLEKKIKSYIKQIRTNKLDEVYLKDTLTWYYENKSEKYNQKSISVRLKEKPLKNTLSNEYYKITNGYKVIPIEVKRIDKHTYAGKLGYHLWVNNSPAYNKEECLNEVLEHLNKNIEINKKLIIENAIKLTEFEKLKKETEKELNNKGE